MALTHSKEPWVLKRTAHRIEIRVSDVSSYAFVLDDEPNARRIVACVNACAGLDVDKLESANKPMWVFVQEVMGQRDELLAAINICLKAEEERCKKILPGAPASTYTKARIEMIKAATTKAKGEV